LGIENFASRITEEVTDDAPDEEFVSWFHFKISKSVKVESFFFTLASNGPVVLTCSFRKISKSGVTVNSEGKPLSTLKKFDHNNRSSNKDTTGLSWDRNQGLRDW